MINCRFKLDDIFTVFSTFYMDQLGKTSRHHWKERLKMRKIAKFESDFLKTYEDIAPQNCENLQTFVWWWWGLGGGQVCAPPPHTNICKISRPWLRKFTDVCMVGESKFVPISPLQTSVKFLDLDCENLQKFVGGESKFVPPLPLQTSVKFLDFEDISPLVFNKSLSNLAILLTLRGSFQWCRRIFPNVSMSKYGWKKLCWRGNLTNNQRANWRKITKVKDPNKKRERNREMVW